MTPALAKKIAEVSGLIPSLKKGTRNNEAGFSYVSIDDYYDQVASILRDNGLIWTITENGCEFVKLDEWYAKFTYLFNLFDIDDTSGVDIDGCTVLSRWPSEISLIHPLQDAQTTGSAMSYAEKIYLRTMFKVVTGEADADAFARSRKKRTLQAPANQTTQETDAFDEVPAPRTKTVTNNTGPVTSNTKRISAEEAKRQTDEFAAIDFPAVSAARIPDDQNLPPATDAMMVEAKCNAVIRALMAVESKPELNDWKKKYEPMIEEIKASPSDQYARLQGVFAEKLAALKGKKKDSANAS